MKGWGKHYKRSKQNHLYHLQMPVHWYIQQLQREVVHNVAIKTQPLAVS